jgi:hypothetical protein
MLADAKAIALAIAQRSENQSGEIEDFWVTGSGRSHLQLPPKGCGRNISRRTESASGFLTNLESTF